MPADAVTALSPQEALQLLNTLGWSLAMSFALLLWFIADRSDREFRKKDGQPSAEATRERLFGRRVVEGTEDEEPAPEAQASGGEKCHAGCPCGNGFEEE
jgi:hypothetical protein